MHGTYPMGINGLGGIGDSGIGAPAPFVYLPNLGPVGSGSAYFPGDVENDAAALVFLHFMSDLDDANRNISRGSQGADMRSGDEAGGFDPLFRAAVARFQAARGLKVDSFIGPQTRGGIAAAVAEANAKGLGGGFVPPLPPAILPVDPGRVPVAPGGLPGITPAKTGPAKAEEDDNTMLYVGGAVAVAAVGGLLWWALSK